MSFSHEQLYERLAALASANAPIRFVVAFSGGLDSSVLLHAISIVQTQIAVPVLAVHVQHDLHADAAAWEAHCRSTATAMAIDYASVRIEVDRDSGLGLEAAARNARYQALQQIVVPGDWLLSAHHQDDHVKVPCPKNVHGLFNAGNTRNPWDGGEVHLMKLSKHML